MHSSGGSDTRRNCPTGHKGSLSRGTGCLSRYESFKSTRRCRGLRSKGNGLAPCGGFSSAKGAHFHRSRLGDSGSWTGTGTESSRRSNQMTCGCRCR